jgi:hypothetical protein
MLRSRLLDLVLVLVVLVQGPIGFTTSAARQEAARGGCCCATACTCATGHAARACTSGPFAAPCAMEPGSCHHAPVEYAPASPWVSTRKFSFTPGTQSSAVTPGPALRLTSMSRGPSPPPPRA